MDMDRLGGGVHVAGGNVEDIMSVGDFGVRMAVGREVSLRWWLLLAAGANTGVFQEGMVAGFAGRISVVVALLDVWRGR